MQNCSLSAAARLRNLKDSALLACLIDLGQPLRVRLNLLGENRSQKGLPSSSRSFQMAPLRETADRAPPLWSLLPNEPSGGCAAPVPNCARETDLSPQTATPFQTRRLRRSRLPDRRPLQSFRCLASYLRHVWAGLVHSPLLQKTLPNSGPPVLDLHQISDGAPPAQDRCKRHPASDPPPQRKGRGVRWPVPGANSRTTTVDCLRLIKVAGSIALIVYAMNTDVFST
jgi:hypothetical protein